MAPLRRLMDCLWYMHLQVVYVARNPKDMCVSYYHHCRHVYNMKGSFEEFAELFLQDKGKTGSWLAREGQVPRQRGNLVPFDLTVPMWVDRWTSAMHQLCFCF